MDEASFWQLIDWTRAASGDDSYQHIELLVEELAKLSESDILDFDTIFDRHKDRAYNRNLWAACQVIGDGGDDSFSDFRGWLIAQGKDVYERALADPDSLADAVDPDTDTQPESFTYVSMKAFERRTGNEDMPPKARTGRVTLTGDDWEEAEKKVPRLRDKFR
ncbi:MAG: DUF4240 domain-containing protein [Anaerolineae bacterium]|nr:DUF4240 domain-containing protein [Anaerolineae bacterium]